MEPEHEHDHVQRRLGDRDPQLRHRQRSRRSRATETLVFNVVAGTGYTVGSPSSATGTIVDNDFATPGVTITATNGVEGGAAVIVSVSRTGSTASTLTVDATRSGTWSADHWTVPTVTGGTGTPVAT